MARAERGLSFDPMPIPTPHKGEPKNKFVSRCTAAIYPEYKEHDGQAVAICEATWRKHKTHAAYVVQAGDDEYAFAKEPVDSDIEKRRKTASNPPSDALPGLNPNGGADPNPGNSNAPSRNLPMRGSDNQEKQTKPGAKKVDSMDQGDKPNLDDMQWYMGSFALTPILDEHTGVAKWPLSFKRIEKDNKRPNKGKPSPDATKPGDGKQEQPPTAV